MPGVFDSGFLAVMEVRFESFRDLLLARLRDDPDLACSDLGNWFEDVARDGQGNFVLHRLPARAGGSFEAIGEQRAAVLFRDWLNLQSPPFLGCLSPTLGVTDLHLRAGANADPVAIGYDTALGATPAPNNLGNFTRNILTDSFGRRWDWALGISGSAMQEITNAVAQEMVGGTTLLGNVELAASRVVGTWGNPIIFEGRAMVTVAGDRTDIDFIAETEILMDAHAFLTLEISVTTDPRDLWDELFGYTSRERADARRVIERAVQNAFHHVFANFAADSVSFWDHICRARMIIGRGVLVAEALDQTADVFRLFGSASVSLAGRPRLVVTNLRTGQALNFGDFGWHEAPVIVFEEEAEHYCRGSYRGLEFITLSLRNDGAGPLFICDVSLIGGNRTGGFEAFAFRTFPFRLEPGETWPLLRINYEGGRVPAEATLQIICNEPPGGLPAVVDQSRFIRRITLRSVAGATTFHVEPLPVEVHVGNTRTGVPRLALSRCRPVPVAVSAGEFRIFNDGDNPLYLCGINADPAGIFAVPFSSTRIEPHDSRRFGALFFPPQVAVTYTFDFVINSNAGDIHVPIVGRVDASPRLGDHGEWIDINVGRACVPPNALCEIMGLFEPIAGADTRAVMRLSIEGVPSEADVVISDREGATYVTDYAGNPSREHDLALTPRPDGEARPNDPCVLQARGGISYPNDLLRVEVTGRLIRPVAEMQVDHDLGPVTAYGSWVYAASGEAIEIIDWRDVSANKPSGSLATGKAHAIASDRDIIVVATATEILAFHTRDPKQPERRAHCELRTEPQTVAVALPWIFVAANDEIDVFALTDGRLTNKETFTLPQPVRTIGVVGNSFYAASERHLILFAVDTEGRARIEDSLSFDETIEQVSLYRGFLLATGGSGTKAISTHRLGKLYVAADYHQRHWSTGFLPIGGGRLLQILKQRRLRLWTAEERRFDRSHFKELLELRYRQERHPQGEESKC